MCVIKSIEIKVEIILVKVLWYLGYRYCKNNKIVFGKLDFIFKKFKIVIFVDLEFFYGKDWEIRKKL